MVLLLLGVEGFGNIYQSTTDSVILFLFCFVLFCFSNSAFKDFSSPDTLTNVQNGT